MIQLSRQGNDVLIPVKVVPKSSRDRVVGELDGSLKVTVSAAPEKGAANRAVCKLIAKTLGVGSSCIYYALRRMGIPMMRAEYKSKKTRPAMTTGREKTAGRAPQQSEDKQNDG